MSKTCSNQICNACDQFHNIPKYFQSWPLGSQKYEKLGYFTLLFGRERQRNVQRFITHVRSYCSVPFVWRRSRGDGDKTKDLKMVLHVRFESLHVPFES